MIPPWAHDGGDKKLIERLKDPAMRGRIRKQMETPSSEWNNEWQQVKGPESFILSAVQNAKLMPLQGKSIAEIAKLWNKDPIDTVFDILIQDEAFTMVGMFIMDEPDWPSQSASRGCPSATTRRVRRSTECSARASASARLAPRMGLNTWAAFGTNDNAAIAGDVAMLASEVTPVLKALRKNGLDVVAMHHHMTGTNPTIYFLHYWGTGPAAKLATGFKAALDELGKGKGSASR